MFNFKNVMSKEVSFFLTKPDKETIGKLIHIKNRTLNIKFNELNELRFEVPYYIEVDNNMVRNPHVDNIKGKFLIRMELGDKKEWFIIDGINKVSEDSDDLLVTCYSLGYQLRGYDIFDFEVTGHNLLMVSDEILKDTGWKTGYVNNKFNLSHRAFEISKDTKLGAIYKIRDTFDAVVVFDTVEKTVNYYDKEELSQYKGFDIGYGKYIQNIEEDIDFSEVVTRLYIRGSDGLTINSVNPTGQSYIDDFSYFLYPFAMDEEGNIISHSYYMSDSLSKALVRYNEHVSSKKDEFSSLLEQKREIQLNKTEEQNSLFELETELQIILDSIAVAKETGGSTNTLIKQRDLTNNKINQKNEVIDNLDQQIEKIDSDIQDLNTDLKMQTHLTDQQMDELYHFIQTDEWVDENLYDVNDLYESGLEKIKEINEPPINITTNIVNFFEVESEKHNWNRFAVGDIIKIDHERLNIDVKTTLSEALFNFDEKTIDIKISNSKRSRTPQEKIEDMLYTVNRVDTDYNKRKINWNKVAYNFNRRNDRIEEVPVQPTNASIKHKHNDDGSVNLVLKWDYPEYSETEKKEHNIDGFIIYLYYDDTDEPYQFTSKMSEETLINVSLATRAYTFPSVPANLFYTVGIRAYRRVDDDIHSDGILMSEIEEFVSGRARQSLMSSSRSSNASRPFSPYQPSPEIMINARLNGSKITASDTPPSNPRVNDIWIDTKRNRLYVWNGTEWVEDYEFEDLKNRIAEHEQYMEEFERELEETLEENKRIVDEAMKELEDELERHEEEMAGIEDDIDEAHIPRSVDPPEDIPESGLWWDESEEPPRLKRWDDENGEWIPLAPTEEDIDDMMDKMREDAVVEGRRYTKMDVLQARKDINDRLNAEIGDVHQHIQDLEDVADRLRERVDDAEEYVDGLREEIGEWGSLIDVVDSHSSWIEQTEEEIRQAVESVTNMEGQITVMETQIAENAEAISLAATKLEVEYLEDEIESITENVAELRVTAEEITSEVGRVEEDLDGRITANSTKIEQTAEGIRTEIDDFKFEYDEDKTDILSRIEENRLDIDATAEGLELRVTKEEFENLEIGTVNLLGNYNIGNYAHTTSRGFDDSGVGTGYIVKVHPNTNYVIHRETSDYNNRFRLYFYNLDTDNYEDLKDNVEHETRAITKDSSLEIKFKTKSDEYWLFVYMSNQLDQRSDIHNNKPKVKLEKGSIATDWSPAPEDALERIAQTEATLDIHADAIEAKAEKSELVNYVDKQEYTNQMGELNVTIDNITSRVSSTEATVDRHTGEIDSARSQIAEIDTTVDGITSTVSDISSDLTTAKSDISRIDQRADSIESTVSSVRTELDDLEIGGRNLIPNSNDFSDYGAYQGATITVTRNVSVPEWGASDATRFRTSGGTTNIKFMRYPSYDEITEYVYSVWIKNLSNKSMEFRINRLRKGGSGGLGSVKVEVEPNESRRISLAGMAYETTNEFQLQYRAINSSDNLDIIVWREQLEKGNKATDWSPAPEDIDARMTATETRITQLPDEIELAVSEGIGDLHTGGTNLLRESQISSTKTWQRDTEIRTDEYEPYVRFWPTSSDGYTFQWLNIPENLVKGLEKGKTYTYSADVRSYGEKRLRLGGRNSGHSPNQTWYKHVTLEEEGTWYRINSTFTLEEESTDGRYLLLYGLQTSSHYSSGIMFDIKNIKIAEENQGSGWSPAPEDGVNKTNVLSSINLSTEGIKIEAPKIDITGLVEFINSDGSSSTMIDGGKIVTRSITTEQLNVNEIFANSLVVEKIQADIVRTANLNAERITTGTLRAARIGARSITANKLNVDEIFGNSAVIAKIQSEAVVTASLDAGRIRTGTLSASRIASGSITAGKLDVSTLSAISANLGTVTAGKLRAIELEGATGTFTGTVSGGRLVSTDGNYNLIIEKAGVSGDYRAGGARYTLDLDPNHLRLDSSSGNNIHIESHGIFFNESGFLDSDASLSSQGYLDEEDGSLKHTLVLGADRVDIQSGIRFSNNSYIYQFAGSSRYVTAFYGDGIGSGGGANLYLYSNRDSSSIAGAFRLYDGVGERIRGVDGEIDLYPNGGETFFIRRNYIGSVAVYDRTYSSTSQQVRVTTNGILGRSTSSRRYKLYEKDISLDYASKVLKLNPKSWYDKRATEDYAHTLSTGEETEVQRIERIGGVIAEDVHDAGLGMYVSYDDQGRPDGLADSLWTLLIPVVKDTRTKQQELEERVRYLEHRDQLKTSQIKQLKERIETLESLAG